MRKQNTNTFNQKYLIVQTTARGFVVLAKTNKKSDAVRKQESLKQRFGSARIFDLKIPTYQNRNVLVK